MGGKGKKGAANNNNNNKVDKPAVVQANTAKKVDPQKEEQMNRIMSGINSMDLDN